MTKEETTITIQVLKRLSRRMQSRVNRAIQTARKHKGTYIHKDGYKRTKDQGKYGWLLARASVWEIARHMIDEEIGALEYERQRSRTT
jgi:hypothetical protein